MKMLLAWIQAREGATAVEYGFIAAGIAVAVMAAIFLLGDDLETLWNTMGSSITNAVTNL